MAYRPVDSESLYSSEQVSVIRSSTVLVRSPGRVTTFGSDRLARDTESGNSTQSAGGVTILREVSTIVLSTEGSRTFCRVQIVLTQKEKSPLKKDPIS